MDVIADFGNFYSKRHNRIVNYLFDQLKFIDRCYRNYNNKNIESVMPEHSEILQLCNAKNPDIVRYDPVTKSIDIVEITICYDLYFEQALNAKHEKYLHLLNVPENLGFKVKMHVLWFGSLGNVPKSCSKMVRKIYKNRGIAKKYFKMVLYVHYYWSKLFLVK